MAEPDRVYAPGDVLQLPDTLGELRAGYWVIVELAWMITLHRLGTNEDGEPCVTHREGKVTFEELSRFVPTGLNVYQSAPGAGEGWPFEE